jgi:hypothetical protein
MSEIGKGTAYTFMAFRSSCPLFQGHRTRDMKRHLLFLVCRILRKEVFFLWGEFRVKRKT